MADSITLLKLILSVALEIAFNPIDMFIEALLTSMPVDPVIAGLVRLISFVGMTSTYYGLIQKIAP